MLVSSRARERAISNIVTGENQTIYMYLFMHAQATVFAPIDWHHADASPTEIHVVREIDFAAEKFFYDEFECR